MGVECPKSGLPGGNVAIVGWWPALANQMASWGRGEHWNRKVPDFGHKGTGYTRFWPLVHIICRVFFTTTACSGGILRTAVQLYQGTNSTSNYGVCDIYKIMLGWKAYTWYQVRVTIIMKPTNSPTQGQPNPRNIGLRVTLFPTTMNFSSVRIGYI